MAVKSQEQRTTTETQISFMDTMPIILAVVFFFSFAFLAYIDGSIAGEIDAFDYLRRTEQVFTGGGLLLFVGPKSGAMFALIGWTLILAFSLLRLTPLARDKANGFFVFGSLISLSHYGITFSQILSADATDVPNAMSALGLGFWLGAILSIALLVLALLPILKKEEWTAQITIRGAVIFASLLALGYSLLRMFQQYILSGTDEGLSLIFWGGLLLSAAILFFAMRDLSQNKEKNEERFFLDTTTPWVTPYAMMLLFITLHTVAPDLNRLDIRIMIFVLMWIGLTSSWNFVGGYTGYIDFGHSVFVGIGGYVAGVLMARMGILNGTLPTEQGAYLWTFSQALPIAFIGGALVAGIIGYPTLRLKGPYFSIAMLGILVAGREIARNDFDLNGIGITNGGIGLSFLAPFSKPLDIYYIMLTLAAMIFFVSLWMYRVQIGKMLKAVRDDEVGADMRGINTTLIKVMIFMLAGGFTAMVGATKTYSDAYIDPDLGFPAIYHITIIMMALLGGVGRPWGPVLGAATFYFARERIWASAGEQHLMITGGLLIAIMLFMPGGILSLLDPEDRGLAWFIRNRLFGQKDRVFDDDEDFEFQDVPDKPIEKADTTREFSTEGRRIVLEGQQVTKDFGGLRAVDHVDFKIYDGEIVGLLGPNGSGKTTLFNCISGVLPTTEGQVFVDGQSVTGWLPWQINRTGLSRTFQRIRVYDKQTVYENMLLARRWKGVPPWMWLWIAPLDVRAKASELVEFLKVDHVQQNLAQNLSGGQQRLLEIGMTLMNDPVVVLLDEATSGVNPALVEDIKEDIRRLNRERGVTFFLVEHNMSFAMELCDRIYVLDYGARIAHGTPEEIQNNPEVIEAYFGRDY